MSSSGLSRHSKPEPEASSTSSGAAAPLATPPASSIAQLPAVIPNAMLVRETIGQAILLGNAARPRAWSTCSRDSLSAFSSLGAALRFGRASTFGDGSTSDAKVCTFRSLTGRCSQSSMARARLASAAARVAAVAASAHLQPACHVQQPTWSSSSLLLNVGVTAVHVPLAWLERNLKEHRALQQMELFRPGFRSRTRGSSRRATGLVAQATERSSCSGAFLQGPITYHPLPVYTQL